MSFHSVVIQKLLSTNAHLGRRVTEHHFKIFSEGTRNSISIIDSDKTLICIRNACNFIGQLARNNARFLFVNTNSLFDEIISQMTEITKIKNDTTWRLGGFLTNSSSPKKFRGRNKKFNLGATQAPDCIVIFDSERKSSVIREADKLQIPVVGLVDSSMSWNTYKKITYPVPANDSVEFVYLFCNLMTKTILKEQKRAMADEGESTTREDVQENVRTVMKDKFFVFPYENLQAVPEDIPETMQLLNKLVVLKFNGILGDKMGFKTPKCVMEIGHGLTCLDLIVNQIDGLNVKYGCNIPLILVNETSADDCIMKVLAKHSNKNIHPVMMSQSKENISNFVPPPAEGEDDKNQMGSLNLAKVFLQLVPSGKLDILFSHGKEYILMLSSDNLAHVVDTKILNHLIRNNIEYCVEVMPKLSEAEGNDILQKKEDFKTPLPKKNWKFIDTMWINMNSIGNLVARRAAREDFTISRLFDESLALSVPKSRYLPVEATSDLLLLKSDLYTLTDGILTRNTTRENPADPSIELGPEFENVKPFQLGSWFSAPIITFHSAQFFFYFSQVNDLHRRFKSIPSIVGLDSLKVTGDVWFGAGITLKGKVSIRARLDMKIVIPDNMVLENTIITSQGDMGGG